MLKGSEALKATGRGSGLPRSEGNDTTALTRRNHCCCGCAAAESQLPQFTSLLLYTRNSVLWVLSPQLPHEKELPAPSLSQNLAKLHPWVTCLAPAAREAGKVTLEFQLLSMEVVMVPRPDSQSRRFPELRKEFRCQAGRSNNKCLTLPTTKGNTINTGK